MNKRLKTIIGLCLCTMLTATFAAGCKSQEKEAGSKVETNKAAETTKVAEPSQDAKQTEPQKDQPITFDMYLNYNWWTINQPFDANNKIAKWIIDNKGVTINYKWASGDEREKLNLMLATDDLPDVIVMERDDMYKKMISMGCLVPLDDFINKYDGYKNAVSEETRNLSKIDGKVYGILNYANSKDWLGYGTGPIINDKIYKQLGSPKLETLDDLVAYLDMVKKADIKIDGKPVIPLQYKAGEANGSHFWSAWGENRVPEEFISYRPIKDGKISFLMNDPKYPEFTGFVNKLYREKYVNQDAFVEKQDQVDEKLATGRVAVYIGSDGGSQVNKALQALQKAGSDVTYSYIAPLAAAGVDRNTIKTTAKSTLGWNIVCITKKAKDPERIYKYLDWLMTAEGQRTVFFGPKGELWDEVDSNGYPILKPGKTLQLSQDEAKVLPLGQYAIPAYSPYYDQAKTKLNGDLPKDKQDWTISEQDRVQLSKYTCDVTQFNSLDPNGGTDEAKIIADVRDYVKTQLTKIVTAKTEEDSLKIMNDTKNEVYKKGFDKVEKIANDRWQENVKQMGIK